MVVDDKLLNNISKLTRSGLDNLEGTQLYNDMLSDKHLTDFLKSIDGLPPEARFITYIVNNPKLARCPKCSEYNSIIECPIIRCEYCDHEYLVITPHNEAVCKRCVADKVNTCQHKPNNDRNISGHE